MATFAKRFKSIQRKYFGSDAKGNVRASTHSPTILAAFESEVEQLAAEQEQYKQENGIQSPGQTNGPPQQEQPQQPQLPAMVPYGGSVGDGNGNMFSLGTDGKDEDPDWLYQSQYGPRAVESETPRVLQARNAAITGAPHTYVTDARNTYMPDKPANYITEDFSDYKPLSDDGNGENWLQRNSIGEKAAYAGAGIAPLLANYLAKSSIEDPKRLDPREYNPSIKSTWFDSRAAETNINNMAASANYGIQQGTGDFDSMLKGYNTINQSAAAQMGSIMQEGQKLNMAEQARIDTLLSDAGKYNAEKNTVADIDLATRQDNTNATRRGYDVAMGENVGGIFNDIGASMLAKKLGKLKGNINRLNNSETA